jgi:hypothetical protein
MDFQQLDDQNVIYKYSAILLSIIIFGFIFALFEGLVFQIVSTEMFILGLCFVLAVNIMEAR